MGIREQIKTGSKLNEWFPSTQNPLIVSAPMYKVSNGTLAAEVTKAGGLGIVPAGFDFASGSAHLSTLATELASARRVLGLADTPHAPLPVGVGFIMCHPSAAHFEKTALPILKEYRPKAVWLFAPHPSAPAEAAQHRIIACLRREGFLVMVQVGTVAAARQAVRDGANVVIAQGTDAGGHQWSAGASALALVPEVRAMLDNERAGDVALLAAGGIVDARGVAAALALGADGAVMGTRFVLSHESSAPQHSRKLLLETSDGGVTTAKSTFYDDIRGTPIWPKVYDGRGVITKSYEDHVAGVPFEENLRRYNAAQKAGDMSRMVTWSGTAVGLITRQMAAGDIVREVREGAARRMKVLALSLL